MNNVCQEKVINNLLENNNVGVNHLALVPKTEEAQTYPKNLALATAFGFNEISLRKQKALHSIALTVRENFFMRNPHITQDNIKNVTERDIENTNTTFNISETLVMACMGYTDKSKYYSYNQILELFEDIADQTIGFDGLGLVANKADKERWKGFTKILASVEREDGSFKFSMPPKMVHRIVNPELSFRSPVSWDGYKTKFTPPIYETCLYYYQSGKETTDWFEIGYLRRITNSTSSTFDDFTKLKKRVIDKALTNIKEADELDLSITCEAQAFDLDATGQNKRGRKKMTHVRFFIAEKVNRLEKNNDVRRGIALSAARAELESLGVARNAISDVINECADASGEVFLPYLRWCTRKGNELLSLKKFKPVLGKGGAKNNFGGYLRKHVIRARKDDWFESHDVMLKSIIENTDNLSRLKIEEYEKQVSSIELKCKKIIAVQYIKTLKDLAFTHVKEDFVAFLETELPDEYARYDSGEYPSEMVTMAEEGTYTFLLYLDYRQDIFNADAFKFAIYTLN